MSKAKIFKGQDGAKLEIPGGGGFEPKFHLWGGMDIFWGHALLSDGCHTRPTMSDLLYILL